MPDCNGTNIFFEPNDPARVPAAEAAHRLAYEIASATVREGAAAQDEAVAALVAGLCDPSTVSQGEMMLALTVHRLATFVGLLARGSDHPFAANLRTHPTLLDADAAAVPQRAEDYLRQLNRLDEITVQLREAFGIDPEVRP